MRKKVLLSVLVLGVVGVGVFQIGKVKAVRADDNAEFRFQYVALFICGFDPSDAFVRIIPGQYATTVGIHNPQSRAVTLRKKIALVFPPAAEKAGSVSAFLTNTLEPDATLKVACSDIPSEFLSSSVVASLPPYIQGFLVIETTRSVDVTASYTAGPTSNPPMTISGFETDARVQTLAVEQIRERRIREEE